MFIVDFKIGYECGSKKIDIPRAKLPIYFSPHIALTENEKELIDK